MQGPQFEMFRPLAAAPAAAAQPATGSFHGDRVAGLPDETERRRIITDLDANLLVEAGAGAGKTTEMVYRMTALVKAGIAVERIAAVTFTRKAAAELRERFQTKLEEQLRRARDAADVAAIETIDRALREIDRAFIGTIHSFCARLLRDRPLEAGIDPDFRETFAVEQERLRQEFFAGHVERLAASGDPSLAALCRVGLRPDQLRRLFDELTEHADVEFPAENVERPDPAAARAALAALVDDALRLMPADEPENGWDNLQTTVRRLRFYRDIVGWNDDTRFLHVLAENLAVMPRATFRCWSDSPGVNPIVRELVRRFEMFAGPEGTGGQVLRQWWAHRYPIVMRFAQRAAEEFERERVRTGAVTFQDLLFSTVKLLRRSPAAREELGERYRFILVDEFQDTDPLQAEVLFLLASPPSPDEEGEPGWRSAVPRPGALFVVGDPKQSIYRFRRADITIYNHVKQRFDEIGGIVRLTANFRSGPPIEKLVDAMFRERFPEQATERQAAFAPLEVQRSLEEGQEVRWYDVPSPGRRPRETELAAVDARRVASWIEERIADGESPGSFLILTRKKRFLTAYAREIEARNLPVQVTGGGVGIEEELAELRALLAALADPADPTLTVAVLVGLFFGLDYEKLAEHVLERRGRLDFIEPSADRETDVDRALGRLHDYWRLARHEPADVVVTSLVYDLGLLPYAAAGELGESRAGALLFVLEAVRNACLRGEASIAGAITAIDAALDADEAEAPLEPGRTDVIRVMNLHQAKGLEADIVVLAAPFGEYDHVPTLHVKRRVSGTAEGWIVVAERRFRMNDTVLARPLDWPDHEAIERSFRDAEEDRLLYVAATRAKRKLIIGHYAVEKDSPWGAFHPWLEAGFQPIELTERAPPPRTRLEQSPAEILEKVDRVNAFRASLARPRWVAAAVRARVKDRESSPFGTAVPTDAGPPPDEDAMAWGKLVHAALEEAGRGTVGQDLRAFCRTRLLTVEEPDLDADGEPVHLGRLLDVAASVMASSLWQRTLRSDLVLVEAPFSLTVPAGEYATLAGTRPVDSTAAQVIDGVIDLAFRENGGWIIVDYKSDRAGAGLEEAILDQYRRQVALYADCWNRLTGEPVRERVILFTSDGGMKSW